MPTGKYFDLLEKECNDDKKQLQNKKQFTNLQELLHIQERVCRICGKNFYIKLSQTAGGYKRSYCYDCISSPIESKDYHEKMIYNPDTKRRVVFKPNGIPRKGTCDQCGKKLGDVYKTVQGYYTTVTKTFIHRGNNKYDPDNQLKDTIELCQSCHCAAQWKDGSLTRWKVGRR